MLFYQYNPKITGRDSPSSVCYNINTLTCSVNNLHISKPKETTLVIGAKDYIRVFGDYYEPHHEKTCILHMGKKRRRSAAQ